MVLRRRALEIGDIRHFQPWQGLSGGVEEMAVACAEIQRQIMPDFGQRCAADQRCGRCTALGHHFNKGLVAQPFDQFDIAMHDHIALVARLHVFGPDAEDQLVALP